MSKSPCGVDDDLTLRCHLSLLYRRCSSRANLIFGLGSTVALASIVLFFLVSRVPLAWPYVKVAAGGLWGALRGFTAMTPGREKCFLTPR